MTRDVPWRLVWLGDLAWRAKRAVECLLTVVTPRTWTR